MDFTELIFANTVRDRVLARRDFAIRKLPEAQWEEAKQQFDLNAAVREYIAEVQEVAGIIRRLPC